jgi:hypothetical protein
MSKNLEKIEDLIYLLENAIDYLKQVEGKIICFGKVSE